MVSRLACLLVALFAAAVCATSLPPTESPTESPTETPTLSPTPAPTPAPTPCNQPFESCGPRIPRVNNGGCCSVVYPRKGSTVKCRPIGYEDSSNVTKVSTCCPRGLVKFDRKCKKHSDCCSNHCNKQTQRCIKPPNEEECVEENELCDPTSDVESDLCCMGTRCAHWAGDGRGQHPKVYRCCSHETRKKGGKCTSHAECCSGYCEDRGDGNFRCGDPITPGPTTSPTPVPTPSPTQEFPPSPGPTASPTHAPVTPTSSPTPAPTPGPTLAYVPPCKRDEARGITDILWTQSREDVCHIACANLVLELGTDWTCDAQLMQQTADDNDFCECAALASDPELPIVTPKNRVTGEFGCHINDGKIEYGVQGVVAPNCTTVPPGQGLPLGETPERFLCACIPN